MEQPENYYNVLGVTKATSDAEIRLAYNILIDSLRSKITADTQAQAAQRKQLLDDALATLLNPDKRKRHDERLDWYVARTRVAADRARDAALRLKQAQEDALEREKAALAAEKLAAEEAARKAKEEARHRAELAWMEAEAAERFRQLREERNPFADTVIPLDDADEHEPTQPAELVPAGPSQAEQSRLYLRALGKKVLVGCIGFAVFFFMTYRLVRQSETRPAPPAVAAAPAAQASAPAQASPAPSPACGASAAGPCEPGTTDQPAVAAAPKPGKAEGAKTAEQLQYQKVLRRVEEEHPELNPDHAGHRADLEAFVAARVAAHVKEGYPRSKALDIAVSDLETQEQTKRMLEKFRNSKETPPPQAAAVLDKGEHQGYDPKCRWVTPEQWSCK